MLKTLDAMLTQNLAYYIQVQTKAIFKPKFLWEISDFYMIFH